MTVGELKDLLNDINDDEMEVVFQPENSDYVEDFSTSVDICAIRAFWGDDFEAAVLVSGGQIGGV